MVADLSNMVAIRLGLCLPLFLLQELFRTWLGQGWGHTGDD